MFSVEFEDTKVKMKPCGSLSVNVRYKHGKNTKISYLLSIGYLAIIVDVTAKTKLVQL